MAESEDIGSVGALGDADPAATYDTTPSTPASPAVNIAQRSARQPSAQEIQDAVKQVNDRLSGSSRVLQLNVDAGTGLTVATIKNSQTGEVLGQFPQHRQHPSRADAGGLVVRQERPARFDRVGRRAPG
jgi:hypothetical protein